MKIPDFRTPFQKKIEKALQNYGGNLRNNIDRANRDWERRPNNKKYYKSYNVFPNPLKKKSYEPPK